MDVEVLHHQLLIQLLDPSEVGVGGPFLLEELDGIVEKGADSLRNHGGSTLRDLPAPVKTKAGSPRGTRQEAS